MKQTLAIVLLIASSHSLIAQPKNQDAEIAAKFNQLTETIEGLDKKNNYWPDVAVYHKAAEWMVRHKEYEHKDAKKNLLQVLDSGLKRATALKEGKTPWLELRGVPIIRGYISKVDGSVQPYAVTLPSETLKDSATFATSEVVLHGRDGTSTEVKFIAQHERQKPNLIYQRVTIEPYGRGNNAFRWAGETDVYEAMQSTAQLTQEMPIFQNSETWLRGFSMGGAGAWHLGLHNPTQWEVVMPGAGFTETHGYIGNLPAQLPEYIEKCLTIYDAVRYAENAINVSIVAYSGGDDKQKQAADNIVNALKGFPYQLNFKHIVAPGLQHKQPPEWLAKVYETAKKFMEKPQPAKRIRFVTYTPRYNDFGEGQIYALEHQYEKGIIEIPFPEKEDTLLTITTTNIRAFTLRIPLGATTKIKLDDQLIVVPKTSPDRLIHFEKIGNQWEANNEFDKTHPLCKHHKLQGPIDDAFMDAFEVVGPTKDGQYPKVSQYAKVQLEMFAHTWDRYLRGKLPEANSELDLNKNLLNKNLILFGDPGSNPIIAIIIDYLPITWTKDKLIVNGVQYDPRTHMPILIYPNPLNTGKYVVINSGHTFTEADLKGTNANLYPHLGDWAVIKVGEKPEVVAAGLFDEFWQFKK